MKKQLSFNSKEFRNAVSVVQRMYDEIYKVAEEKIQKIDMFKGQLVRRPTEGVKGKREEDIFLSKIKVSGISVNITMRLKWIIDFYGGYYKLESFEFSGIESTSCKYQVNKENLRQFKILCDREFDRYNVRV